MREHYIDPDFRRQPKTLIYCCVCYRDLLPTAAAKVRLSVEGWGALIHPDDATDGNSEIALVGPKCSADIPQEFFLKPQTPKPQM